MKSLRALSAALAFFACASHAQPTFVNALVLDGASLDASGGTLVNNGRLGFFSDIYYDSARSRIA
jgi:hypothetical protein